MAKTMLPREKFESVSYQIRVVCKSEGFGWKVCSDQSNQVTTSGIEVYASQEAAHRAGERALVALLEELV